MNCQFPARAAWHALRLKLLPRIACSRHRLLPGCDTPADSLRRALWSRVSHTRRLGRRRAKLDRAKSPEPTPDYLPRCHFPDQRPAFVAIARWPPPCDRSRPGRPQGNYARLYCPVEVRDFSASGRWLHRISVAATEQALTHNGPRHFHRAKQGRGESELLHCPSGHALLLSWLDR